SLVSRGLGSNSSTWLLPPAMKMKMHDRAPDPKWVGRGASGPAARSGGWTGVSPARTPSPWSIASRAALPRPLAAPVRKRLRSRSRLLGGDDLFTRDELVEVEQGACDPDPRGRVRRADPDRQR